MRAQVDTTQRKNKIKQSTKKKGKSPMQIGTMAMKWRSTKTWDKRAIVYHKSTNEGGALAMTCERDE